MRFHKFNVYTPDSPVRKHIWIDLDQVTAVEPGWSPASGCYVHSGFSCSCVEGDAEDILALIRGEDKIEDPAAKCERWHETIRDAHRCPDCGYPEGSLHDSGCPQNQRRRTVKPSISDMVLTPKGTQPARHDVRTAACLAELARFEDELMEAFPSPLRSWAHEYIATRRRELVEGED